MQLASTILMIRPKHFGYNAETAADNVFQSKVETGIDETAQKAQSEFDAMMQVLKENAIDTVIVEDTDDPVKPDAVFCNNWICTMPDGSMYTFPLKAENRRLEIRQDIVDNLQNDFFVKRFEDLSEKAGHHIYLESTGSICFDHINKIAYACISQRTNESFLKEFCAKINYKPFCFAASVKDGKEIYHTNVMMHIGETYAVVCLEALEEVKQQIELSNLLRKTGHDIISISYQQMNSFAGNMLQIKNKNDKKITLLSKTAFDSLRSEQKYIFNRHTHLLPVDISLIEKAGGGSVRCMITEIFLKKKDE